MGVRFTVQRRAERAHEARDIGPYHLDAHLLLECPQHGLIVEGAALDDNPAAQLLGRGGANYLIKGVLYDGNAQSGADILQSRAILLRLLDGGVHEHRAAAAEVDRPLGKEAEGGEVLHAVAQRLRKSL